MEDQRRREASRAYRRELGGRVAGGVRAFARQGATIVPLLLAMRATDHVIDAFWPEDGFEAFVVWYLELQALVGCYSLILSAVRRSRRGNAGGSG